MYHTTGFAKDEIIDLCALVYANEENSDTDPWPRSLGLYKSVVIALTYMRRNRVQQELAETYETSQSTISRANSRITSRLAIVLAPFVPTAEDLDPDTQYIYDGTLLPCWSWREHRELYSGKHKTTGKNVQVACNLYGELAWISDPVDGSRHDAHCIDESSVLAGFPEKSQIGDKGYVGKRMITPIRKPESRDLLDWEKEFNTQVNKIRYLIEQVIANFKTWRIIHTDYRRPLDTFDTTISAVIGLHFYRTACRVGDWRGGSLALGPGAFVAAGFPVGCATPVSLARSAPFPVPAASNRACGSPAHGSPTPFTAGIRLFPPGLARPGRDGDSIQADQAEVTG